MKDIVERKEINVFRRIFTIGCGDILNYDIRDLLKLLLIIPDLFKKFDKVLCVLITFCFLYRIIGIIPAFTTEINRRKTIDGHISTFINRKKAHHLLLRDIRFENYLSPNPISAFFGDCFLRQLIAQLHFKFCTIKTALSGYTGNVEFALGF